MRKSRLRVEVGDAAPVAVDEEKRLAGTVNLVIQADIVVREGTTGGGVGEVGGLWRRVRCCCKRQEKSQEDEENFGVQWVGLREQYRRRGARFITKVQ